MTVDVDEIRTQYRETVAATAQGGSGEDFATLAAYLPALCDELEAAAVKVRVLVAALEKIAPFEGRIDDQAWGPESGVEILSLTAEIGEIILDALAAVGDA
jgi:hypothetical protein